MTLPETFITKFTIGNPNNCWLWTAATVSGYGVITINSVRHYAHRYMYEHHNGSIPTGKYVYHTCDERSCVNPDHLFVGVPSLRKHEGGFRCGEDHPKAKLSRESVVKMRDEFDGTRSCVMRYAKEHGVTSNTIMSMLRGKTWRNICGSVFSGDIDTKSGFPHGENHPEAKLSREDVIEIRDGFDGTRSCALQYAKKYNVAVGVILLVLRNNTYKNVGGKIFTGKIKMDVGGRGNRRLTQKQIDDIRARYTNGETQASLAREYGVHYSHVSRICRGERWGK